MNLSETLTRIPKIDFRILSNLDDLTLVRYCLSVEENSYEDKICRNEKFWKFRTLDKYGDIEKSYGKTWRNFYLELLAKSSE